MGDCFQLQKCCGCIDLRSGCFVIAYVQLVAEIIYSIILAYGFIEGTLYDIVLVAIASQYPGVYVDLHYVRLVTIVFVVTFVFLFMLFLSLGFTLTLIIGLHTSKRTPVKVYLVFAWIILAMQLICFFCLFTYTPETLVVLLYSISIAIYIYFTITIRSYYVQLTEGAIGASPSVYKQDLSHTNRGFTTADIEHVQEI